MANTATQVSCRVFKTKGASVSANYSGHSGVDVTADGGFDYVVAHSAGEVVWVQTGYGNLKGSEGDPSYGNAVQLRHANGWCTLYAHMREVNVSYGQQVGRGAVLGYMGDSGNATARTCTSRCATPPIRRSASARAITSTPTCPALRAAARRPRTRKRVQAAWKFRR